MFYIYDSLSSRLKESKARERVPKTASLAFSFYKHVFHVSYLFVAAQELCILKLYD